MAERNKALPPIYFDMDGVLAEWRVVPVEETYRRGFFSEARVNWPLVSVIEALVASGYDVRILSAAYNHRVRREKRRWLRRAGLGSLPVKFVEYGSSKADAVPDAAILVDDFSQNLREWSSVYGHYGVKYYNGVNGTRGSRWAYSCSVWDTPQYVFQLLEAVMVRLNNANYRFQYGNISRYR